MRYYGFFSVAWLVGWFAGFVDTVSKLWSSEVPASFVFWVKAWTRKWNRSDICALSARAAAPYRGDPAHSVLG